MSKRFVLMFVILTMSSLSLGCSKKPPYDAKVIDKSELDTPIQQERSKPASGGGKALSERQW